jgi:hypothetical protein
MGGPGPRSYGLPFPQQVDLLLNLELKARCNSCFLCDLEKPSKSIDCTALAPSIPENHPREIHIKSEKDIPRC